MRVMALDVGEKRIGVALSDPTGMLATPLTTISRQQQDADFGEVTRLAAEHEVDEIVVGMPISLSGRIGAQAGRVSRFADALTERSSLPVRSYDERYSSKEAERLIREAGSSPSRNKARIDAVAAAVILQSYLDSRRLAEAEESSAP